MYLINMGGAPCRSQTETLPTISLDGKGADAVAEVFQNAAGDDGPMAGPMKSVQECLDSSDDHPVRPEADPDRAPQRARPSDD